jgi:hypothetical protein
MASTRIIEEERGTYRGQFSHKHNGYYAGDFSTPNRPMLGTWHPEADSTFGVVHTF